MPIQPKTSQILPRICQNLRPRAGCRLSSASGAQETSTDLLRRANQVRARRAASSGERANFRGLVREAVSKPIFVRTCSVHSIFNRYKICVLLRGSALKQWAEKGISVSNFGDISKKIAKPLPHLVDRCENLKIELDDFVDLKNVAKFIFASKKRYRYSRKRANICQQFLTLLVWGKIL